MKKLLSFIVALCLMLGVCIGATASAKPFAFGLKIVFNARYFPRQASRIEQDLEEIYHNYVEK